MFRIVLTFCLVFFNWKNSCVFWVINKYKRNLHLHSVCDSTPTDGDSALWRVGLLLIMMVMQMQLFEYYCLQTARTNKQL